MSKKKKILFILLLFVVIFVLSACGIDVVNEVNVDKEFAGSRIMTISADSETINNVEGGSAALTNFLQNEVTAPLQLEILEQTETSLSAKITLSFTSVDDYIEKLNQISAVDGENPIEVNYSYPTDNPFITGVTFKDNSEAKIILNSLVDKAIEQGLIAESDRNSVWDDETYSLTIDGEKLIDNASYAPWSVENENYQGPRDILMSTSPRENGNWDRVYYVLFPNDVTPIENWKEELFKDVSFRELGSEETDVLFYTATAYSFIVEDATDEALASINNSMLGVDNSELDLEIVPNTTDFNIDLNISEKIGSFPLVDSLDINTLYYTEPKKPEEHSLSSFTTYNYDVYTATENNLLEGYNETVKIEPKFQKAHIVTNISKDKSLDRTITIDKAVGFYGEKSNELLTKYLNDNEIQFSVTDEQYVITYNGENFESKNSLLFTSNPNIVQREDSLFKYNYVYSDYTTFKLFDFPEITQETNGPSGADTETILSNSSDGFIQNEIMISGTKVLNIVLTVIISLLLIGAFFALILLMIRHQKTIKKAEEEDRKNSFSTSQSTREPYKRQNPFEDTAPIQKLTDDSFISAEDGSVIVDGDEFI